ncbi:DUF6631 family protein [Providencia sp. TYF-12]|uniref:DUF6631 family protein n=1 Tax=unclassified Providencia TaxID=2633465 RepID=UPI003523981D
MSESLAILLPERTLTLAGKEVVVHEYTLAEQLKYRAPLKAISDGFKALMLNSPDAEVTLDELYDLMGTLANEVIQVAAVSCSESVEWVSALTGEDSDALLMVWWGVNAAFFTRSALREKMVEMARAKQALLIGQASSPVLSTTDTTTAHSPITQPDN